MNRLKYLRFLFVLFVVLTVFFGILLFVEDMRDNVLGRIGLWCGLISQLLLAVVMYSEIRKEKKGQNNKAPFYFTEIVRLHLIIFYSPTACSSFLTTVSGLMLVRQA